MPASRAAATVIIALIGCTPLTMRHSETEILDPIIVSTCLDQLRTGTINKLTFKLAPEQLLAQDKAEAEKKLAADRD